MKKCRNFIGGPGRRRKRERKRERVRVSERERERERERDCLRRMSEKGNMQINFYN